MIEKVGHVSIRVSFDFGARKDMDLTHAETLFSELPKDAIVVDVGGGASPFPRANYIIDSLPYQQRSALGELQIDCHPHFKAETWVELDLCEHKPWPFPDKFFDFATCSHLLEDVRDPIWICSELCRVAKAGYIEVPSRYLEQSLGVEHPSYAGFYHHRWLITQKGNGLEFRHKAHSLHSCRDAIVSRVGVSTTLNPKHSIFTFRWIDRFEFREVLEFDESKVITEMVEFAKQARQLPDLTVSSNRSFKDMLKRYLYFRRLRLGGR